MKKSNTYIVRISLLFMALSLGLMSFAEGEGHNQPERHYKEVKHYTRNISHGTNALQGVVLHHTATRTCKSAVSILCCDTTHVSAHVVIDRNGTRYILAKPQAITWHAGRSYAFHKENANNFTLGIEFQGNTCNGGRLTTDQIHSAIEYLIPIMKQHKIAVDHIVTHKMVRDAYLKRHPKATYEDGTKVPGKPDISNSEYNRFIDSLKLHLSRLEDARLKENEKEKAGGELLEETDSLTRVDSLISLVRDANQQTPLFHSLIPADRVIIKSGEYKDRENFYPIPWISKLFIKHNHHNIILIPDRISSRVLCGR